MLFGQHGPAQRLWFTLWRRTDPN